MVTPDKIDALRAELGPDADRVMFTDMADAGRNPGRIISHWSDFAGEHVAAGGRARGIGEPVWAGRTPDELVECQQHESLINAAFEDADGFRLVCPYDTESLPADVIHEARRTHPLTLEGGEPSACADYVEDRALALHREPLAPPDGPTLEVRYDAMTLERVRRLVRELADEAELPDERAEDLVIAVNEAATNSVRYGGGSGAVRVWTSGGALVCEVRDRGLIDNPVTGRMRPRSEVGDGHGLWLAHQVCDLVQVRSTRRGTVVRMVMRTTTAESFD